MYAIHSPADYVRYPSYIGLYMYYPFVLAISYGDGYTLYALITLVMGEFSSVWLPSFYLFIDLF